MLILIVNQINAQEILDYNLQDTLPNDPLIRAGELNNGFKYYIKSTSEVADITLELLIKTGIENEIEGQYGVAHLLEHLALKSTVNYPEIKKHLNSKGLKFGRDFNGATGRNFTKFVVSKIPKNDDELFLDVLNIFKDFANNGINITKENVKLESEVVLQEFRMDEVYYKDKINYSIANKLFESSKYSEQFFLSNNTLKNVEKFNIKSIKQFYEKWYKPNNQALIIIGNFNAEQVENLVRNLFEGIQSKTTDDNSYTVQKSRIREIKSNNKSVTFLKDENKKNIEFKIYKKLPFFDNHTFVDLENNLIRELYNLAINKRLEKIQKLESLNIIELSSYYYPTFRNYGPKFGSIETKIKLDTLDNIQSMFKIVATEMEILKREGITDLELDLAKSDYINFNLISDNQLFDLENNFLHHLPYPSPEFKAKINKSILKQIDIVQFNNKLKKLLQDWDTDVFIITSKNSKNIPELEEILSWVKDVEEDKTIKSVVDLDRKTDLDEILAEIERNFSDYKSSLNYQKFFYDSIGITKLILSNKTQIYLKPIVLPYQDHNKDRVFIKALSKHGLSHLNDQSFLLGLYSPKIVRRSGLIDLSPTKLNDFMSSKGIAINIDSNNQSNFIQASSKPNDFELMLQLFCLFKNKPKLDSNVSHAYLLKEFDEIQKSKIADNYNTVISQYLNESRVKNIEPKDLLEIKGEDLLDYYKAVFTHKSDFTYVVTGNFDVETIIPFLVKYLDKPYSFPRIENSDNYSSCLEPNKSQNGLVRIINSKTNKNNSRVQIYFKNRHNYTTKLSIEIKMLGIILKTLINERLREKEGLVYYASILNNINQPNLGDSLIGIAYECETENIDESIEYCFEEIESIKLGAKEMDDLIKSAKNEVMDQLENDIMSVNYWTNYIEESILSGLEITRILDYKKILETIDLEEIENFVINYLDRKNSLIFIQKPNSQ